MNLPDAGPKLNNKMRELEPWRWTFVGAYGFPPTQRPSQATVRISTTGDGLVRGAGTDCRGGCSATFATGTQVQLEAVPDPGFVSYTEFQGLNFATAWLNCVTLGKSRQVVASGEPAVCFEICRQPTTSA